MADQKTLLITVMACLVTIIVLTVIHGDAAAHDLTVAVAAVVGGMAGIAQGGKKQ